MKKSLLYVVLIDVLFLLILTFSSIVEGILSDLVYCIAFLLPLIVYFYISRLPDMPERSVSLISDKRSVLMTLPLVAPTVALVFSVAALSAYIFSLFGISSETDVSGNIFSVVFTRAVLPAVLEELLFRFVPLNLFDKDKRKIAVFFSAFMFALVHSNPVQMPYAFVAGVVFALIDIAAGSIYPSLIVHFVNNLLSVIWMRLGVEALPVLIISLSAVTLLSLAVMVFMRKSYRRFFYEHG